MPGHHAIILLAVTLATFFLYTRAWIRMELVSLLLLLSLLLLFHFFPYDGMGERLSDATIFQAFGHPALVAICSLMILAQGLTMTGAMEPVVQVLTRVWRWNRGAGLLLTLALACTVSGFVNDTPVLVLMLPMLLGVARRSGHGVGRALMPVNFAILAGGMLTSVGTSTNLLVLSIAADMGMRPMGLFDFTGIAATSLLVTLPYLWLLAPRLLPERGGQQRAAERIYAARIVVPEQGDALRNRTLARAGRRLGRPLPVAGVQRGSAELAIAADTVLQAGDALILNDTVQGLTEIASLFKVDLYDRSGMSHFVEQDASKVDIQLAEVVIGAEAGLVDRTLAGARFAQQHGVAVVGISRGTEDLLRREAGLGSVRLAAGDVLLVQAPLPRIEALKSEPGLLVVGGDMPLPHTPQARWALAIMVAVIAVAALKWLPIHVAAFIGVIAMLLARCVRLEGLGRALSLQVVLLVASSIALGHALVATGAANWLAGGVAHLASGLAPAWQLALFMAFSALLTNFVSNSAAAAVGTPVAVAAAASLGQPLEPFVLAVLFGANLSYATPMAYQTNLLVMNAAGYRFADFVRVGLPLVLLLLAVLSWLLVRSYGL
ncbi:MAG TPA: SLC13 family permease [Steroidobacteraceae bacterium]|nr:SLC13 family permease [Steroidobacteraceae bacterium]